MSAFSKSALALIAGYGEDDEDEDDVVPGPRVSTKRSLPSDCRENDVGAKRNGESRLPVPDSVKSLFADSVDPRAVDRPEEHQGRLRSFPHVRGNWATYVYASGADVDWRTLQQSVCHALSASLGQLQFNAVEEPHISVTRVVTLQHHWIDSFVSSASKALSEMSAFSVFWTGLNVFVNEEGTRTFIGLGVNGHQLVDVAKRFDNVLDQFRLPAFYSDPSFHVSLLWCLGDHGVALRGHVAHLNQVLDRLVSEEGFEDSMDICEFEAKIGNKLFRLPLLNPKPFH